jgi:hypothetical protein
MSEYLDDRYFMSEEELEFEMQMDRIDCQISQICGGMSKDEISCFIYYHRHDPGFGITSYDRMKKVIINGRIPFSVREGMLDKLRNAIATEAQESKSGEQRVFEHVMKHPVLYGAIAGIGFGLASSMWDDMWNQGKKKD